MAIQDASDAQGGGDRAFAYFVTSEIPSIVKGLIELERVAHERGLTALAEGANRVLDGLLADVNKTAVEYAGYAQGAIVRKMLETHAKNRPLQGDMETHIICAPGPLGSVRVALISELNKIVNQRGAWDTYWQAQEYGTGAQGFLGDVPTQIGRPLFGTFTPSETPPEGAQAGLGVGHDLAFIPRGSNPGFGRINVDLPGRHFLRDGSEEAGERYIAAMGQVQAKWLAKLNALASDFRTTGAGRIFTGIIRA